VFVLDSVEVPKQAIQHNSNTCFTNMVVKPFYPLDSGSIKGMEKKEGD
jgi:hypothetical protein